MNETVIGSSPNKIAIERRNRQRRNQRIDFRSRLVEIDGAAARRLGARLVTSEVGRNLLPCRAVVVALEYTLGGSEQLLGVRRRKQNGTGPTKAVFEFA